MQNRLAFGCRSAEDSVKSCFGLLTQFLKHTVLFYVVPSPRLYYIQGVLRLRYTKIHAYVLVPKSFMKFMFSTVYRVTQKVFYAHPYTSMRATDFRQRIIKAVELITPHMLINTWQELEYSLDICRATTGAHSESVRTCIKIFLSYSVHC
jgi:hypothetical protein